MIRSLTLRAAALALFFFGWVSSAQAVYPEVLFILDSSGSMKEDAGAERKIDAAKRVMAEVVPSLEPEVRAGLVAYGHRLPGSCTDIETLIPAGSDDRELLLRMVESLQPKGKTPISAAILNAASMLRNKDAETSIVLVSDGVETCGGDPCEVVRQLKAAGVNFVLHVVGFDVDPNAAAQLECLANQGGGDYFSAADGDALLTALTTVGAGVTSKVEAARVTMVGRKSGLGKLAISMPGGSQESLHAIEITRVSDGKVVKTIEKPDPESTHPLLSGEYRVTALFGTPNFGEPTRTDWGVVTVTRGETREVELGAIALNLPEGLIKADWKNRINLEEVRLYAAGTDELVVSVLDNRNGHYNYLDKPVPAGIYDVRFLYSGGESPTTVARQVAVQSGRTETVTLDSGVRMQKSKAGVTAWRLFRHTDQTLDAAEDGGTTVAPRELALEATAAWNGKDRLWFPYLLPPGTFDIEVVIKGMEEPLPVAEGVTISAGELLQFDMGL